MEYIAMRCASRSMFLASHVRVLSASNRPSDSVIDAIYTILYIMTMKIKKENMASACGKIILSGEYAVLFGYPGIAVPAPLHLTANFEEDPAGDDIIVHWNTNHQSLITNHWQSYAQEIVNHCLTLGSVSPGTLTIENQIPLGKGMGSSTALVIAIARCLLREDCEHEARMIEEAVNAGASGIDFAVIWNESPVYFVKGSEPESISLPDDLLHNALLIDTGTPDQQTPELVAWIREREDELQDALATIGDCTKRLKLLIANTDGLQHIIRDHNAAQQALGVVSDKAKSLIKIIEQEGGAAKVIGAGGRTGGSGMVLVINCDANVIPSGYPVIRLDT